METVKVDVQKLQLLNDRIAQTIEALNQVRMSVHGIQHSQYGQTPYGQPFGQAPFGQAPFGQAPFGPAQFGPAQFGQTPFGQTQFGQPMQYGYPVQQYPLHLQYLPQYAPQYASYGSPYGAQFVPGIQHTPFTSASTPWAQTSSPWAQTSSPWSIPYVGNGISHTTDTATPWQTWLGRMSTTPWTWSY